MFKVGDRVKVIDPIGALNIGDVGSVIGYSDASILRLNSDRGGVYFIHDKRLALEDSINPTAVQVGGTHYKSLKIQPIEYIHANGIPFAEGSVIKYVTRWRDKGGIKDLEKARHFIDLLIELEGRK